MRFVSLEKKLPLLIGGLVAAALIVTLTLVRRPAADPEIVRRVATGEGEPGRGARFTLRLPQPA